MEKTLTANQAAVLTDMRARGWFFAADQAQRHWTAGRASYVDDRTLCNAKGRRNFVRAFKAANREATA